MIQTNLFPAILIAGAPNCGKSVLSFLLTQRLRAAGISHYLLRTAPDGEGDWSQEGNLDIVRQIRVTHKRTYTLQLVRHMCAAIENRMLPMLVDIGGKPRADQLDILRACTHSILLYRSESEKVEWQEIMADMSLLPIAELRSDLEGSDTLLENDGILQATIAGLDRDRTRRRTGAALDKLVKLVAGICQYSEAYLLANHLRQAPLPLLLEKDLANALGVKAEGERNVWSPADLGRLPDRVQRGQPIALYGRGPVWLAAALAAQALPADVALFDARYGWLQLSEIHASSNKQVKSDLLTFDLKPYPAANNPGGAWVEIALKDNLIEPHEVFLPKLAGNEGLVLSGKLPRWYFAALVRHFARSRAWVATYVPALNCAIVVASHSAAFPVGMTLAGKA